MQEKNLSFEQLKLELNGKDSPKKTKMLEEWLQKTDTKVKFKTLKNDIFPLVNRSARVSLLANWYTKDDAKIELLELKDLKEILLPLTHVVLNDSLVNQWLKKPENKLELQDLKEILPWIDQNKSGNLFEKWLVKPDSKLEFIGIKEVFLLVDGKRRSAIPKRNWTGIIEKWFEKANTEVDLKILKEALLLVNRDNKSNDLFEKWLVKPDSELELTGLKEIFLLADDEGKVLIDVRNRPAILSKWLEKPDTEVELTPLKEILPLVDDNYKRIELFDKYFKKSGNNLKLEELDKTFSFADYKGLALTAWLKKPDNNFNLEYLKVILHSVDPNDQFTPLVCSWLQKPDNNFNSEDLKKILPLANKGVDGGVMVANIWFEKSGNNPTLEDVKEILPLVLPGHRLGVLSKWLNKEATQEAKYNKFVEAVNADALGSKYNYEAIEAIFYTLSLPNEKIPDLCKALYPNNEFIQAELFNEFISRRQFNKTEADIAIIKKFTATLSGGDVALSVLKTAQSSIGLSESNVLEIASNRLSSRYESIKDLLEGKTLADSLTLEGMQVVQQLFGEKADTTSLVSLFSYYDIQNDVGTFVSIIKPEVSAEISAKFEPTAKDAYVQEAEYTKLQALVEGLSLPPMTDLCNYLKSKVPPIPQLDAAAIDAYNINFANSVSVTAEKHGEINTAFRALLKSNNPAAEEVAALFKKALNLDFDINTDQQGKLRDSFAANKNEAAALFATPGGLDKFKVCIDTLGDGCVANFGTQFRTSLYQSLITDPAAQILYGCFVDNISRPILNSGGDKLGGSAKGSDILNHAAINASKLSPNGLVAKMEQEFVAAGKTGETIEREAGMQTRRCLLQLWENDYDSLNQNAAQMATCLTLKTAMPALLDSPYLKDTNDTFRSALDGAQKIAIEENEAFYKVASAIVNSTKKPDEQSHNQIYTAQLTTALKNAFDDGDVDSLKVALKLKLGDPIAEPDSHVMQTNSKIKDFAKTINPDMTPEQMTGAARALANPPAEGRATTSGRA